MSNVNSQVDVKSLQAQIEQLKAANAALTAEANAPRKLTLKVSAKGALSVYGMGRFPITLYVSQWEQVLSMAEQIRAFIKDNSAKLATKASAATAA